MHQMQQNYVMSLLKTLTVNFSATYFNSLPFSAAFSFYLQISLSLRASKLWVFENEPHLKTAELIWTEQQDEKNESKLEFSISENVHTKMAINNSVGSHPLVCACQFLIFRSFSWKQENSWKKGWLLIYVHLNYTQKLTHTWHTTPKGQKTKLGFVFVFQLF